MTRKNVHYEAAFVDYLRSREIPYVPVDESRKVSVCGAKLKSFDLVMYAPGDRRWIVDIKGRQFPYISEQGGRRYWENWVTREDLDGLREWEGVFGSSFEACFVFAYLLDGPADRWPFVLPYRFRGDDYAFMAIMLADYTRHARLRSPRWDTFSMSTTLFRQHARPIEGLGALRG